MKTREIRLNGKKYVLTLEEIHKINLIRKGLALQKKMEPLKKALDELKSELAGMAVAVREGKRMIRLDGIICEAEVTWNRDISINPERVPALKAKLGEKFEQFLEAKTDYKLTKEYNLLTKAQDGKSKELLNLIAGALMIKENGPYTKLKEK
jgi:hypothetical protein